MLTSRNACYRIVFTSDVTDKLRSVLNGAAAQPAPTQSRQDSNKTSQEEASRNNQSLNTSRFKKASAGGFKSTFVTSTVAPVSSAAPGDDEDLDGEAMDQDLDGEAIEEDLDGEAMDADEDLDGEAM